MYDIVYKHDVLFQIQKKYKSHKRNKFIYLRPKIPIFQQSECVIGFYTI